MEKLLCKNQIGTAMFDNMKMAFWTIQKQMNDESVVSLLFVPEFEPVRRAERLETNNQMQMVASTQFHTRLTLRNIECVFS